MGNLMIFKKFIAEKSRTMLSGYNNAICMRG